MCDFPVVNETIFFSSLQVTGPSGWADDCQCVIRDIKCVDCNDTLGYRVDDPCVTCLRTTTNMHRYIFLDGSVVAITRKRAGCSSPITWGALWSEDDDDDDDNYNVSPKFRRVDYPPTAGR